MLNRYLNQLFIIPISFVVLISCGGGGGGGGGEPSTPSPQPVVSLSADQTSVLVDSSTNLTWSSTNANSCSASWTSQTTTSGTASVTISTVGNNNFSITCSGAGGNGSASISIEGYRNTDGVVVDGYISGAEVCIDEDNSWTCDSDESSTTSDNDGKFTIKYANGNLVSIGGTDLDSQVLLENFLITHALDGHTDFKALTPVTSVAAFMQDSSLINAALGIDSSIDVFSFDPVENKGDGDINDYLYEKGNQLTILALALQNVVNNSNSTADTTQDYFKAIAEEIEKEYEETSIRVNIETEEFITKAFNNIIAAKEASISETNQANAITAISALIPVIEIKSSNELTTSVIRFGLSTFQTDIKAISDGTATELTVDRYAETILDYIAEDQSVSATDIAVSVNAVSESVTTNEDTAVTVNVLLNDSYNPAEPLSLTVSNGTNGTTAIAESSPEQIVYTPNLNYNGNDVFTYTITQGGLTSSANVSVTIEPVNDAPSIDATSILEAEENQSSVATIAVSDVDNDQLELSMSGVDADSLNLSNDNVLTFKEDPDYETKSSYEITLSLTDGIETVTKDITIQIIDISYVFTGKVMDGYISGAEIYFDQNFNFTKDEGEFSATTLEDGSFIIDTGDNETLGACLAKRPIIADVPVGAIDSTLGEVTSAYQMILPSIDDTGFDAIVISPFTTLLGDAVIQGVNASDIVDELDIDAGCSDVGDAIATNISNELLQIKNSIEASLEISFDNLLVDFIEDSPNSTVTEAAAQNIAVFFPFFKELSDEFDAELTDIHQKNINTQVLIEKDSVNSILSSTEIEEMPLSFNAIYKTEPNDLGWYIEEKIVANGANISNSGEMEHFKCFSNDAQNCVTNTRSLDALRNASKRYTRTSSFKNDSYDPTNYSYRLVVEDEQRVDFDIDGNPLYRVCIDQNWLYLTPLNEAENFSTNDRYNTGVAHATSADDDCVSVINARDEALFVALVESFDDGINFEELDIRITNNKYAESTFFENKVNNIYQNRDTLDLDPLIQEIGSVPRTLREIETLRAKLNESSTDQISIYWAKRDADSQLVETSRIDINYDRNKDVFEYGTYENSSFGSEYTQVLKTEGQEARNAIVDTLYEKSAVFNNSDYLSYAPVFSSAAVYSIDENEVNVGTATATDADGDDVSFTITSDDLEITTDGVLTFISAPDYETQTSYTATITVSDGTNITTQDITINVNNINDNTPTITSVDTFNIDENLTAIGTLTGDDADGDAISFSISGDDASSVSVNATSGVLVFNTAPDFESKTAYSIVATVDDGLFSATQNITININNVDEPPVFTSSDTFSADENQTSMGSIAATDPEGASVSYSISGSDAGALSISDSGVITFDSAPNYEVKNTYSITATANDGTIAATQDITININDVNDVPVVSAASYTLNLLPQDQTTKTLTLAASDEDGDTLTYTVVDNGSYGTASFTAQSATETIGVSVEANNSGSGNVYVIDGTQNKAITLNVGTTYTFSHPQAHPLRFSTTSDGTHGGGSEFTTGVTTSDGSTVIEVTSSTPTTLYYYCSIHAGMGASATMVNSNGDSSITYKTSASTQAAQSETFTFKVNDGTVDSDNATISIDLRTDPLYQYQWHLNNTGQTNFATNAGTAGQDLNVDSVIIDGITGNGIKISIVDDGLEIAHEDLVDNVISGSWNFVNSSTDPTQPTSDEGGGHGTSIGGIIAAKGWNNIGVRGIAPNASMFGYNYLENQTTTNNNQAHGINPPGGVTADIYNMSYGIGYGSGNTRYSLQQFLSTSTEEKFINGTSNLRDGKGALYIKSSGNDYDTQSDSICGTDKPLSCTETSIDNKNQSPYIIVVGALGADGEKTSYSTPGSSIWVSGFGGEFGYDSNVYNVSGVSLDPAIMTVDRSSCSLGYSRSGDNSSYGKNKFNLAGYNFSEQLNLNPDCNYNSHFNGTSAAAPTVSGVVALMLEANPDLTWRDVKHILVNTSAKIDATRSTTVDGVTQYSWVQNAAGHEHHNWYGFGKVDASAAVNVAKDFTANNLGSFVTTGFISETVNGEIPDNSGGSVQLALTKPSGSNGKIEFVRVSIDFDHTEPWSVGFRLQSPDGTILNIMQPYTNLNNPGGGYYFDIGVSGFYGENMEGDWVLEARDYSEGTTGVLKRWGIELYGN